MQEKEIKGLTPEEVIKSREEYGENILTPPKKESVWMMFIEKFNDPIIKVLLVAALLSPGGCRRESADDVLRLRCSGYI